MQTTPLLTKSPMGSLISIITFLIFDFWFWKTNSQPQAYQTSAVLLSSIPGSIFLIC